MTNQEQIIALQAKLNLIHDHLHHERFNEAHEVCHCDRVEDLNAALPGSNVSQVAASSLDRFAHDFNKLAGESGLRVCFVAFVESATKIGFVSTQIGGNVSAIQLLRQLLGQAPTAAVGNHPKKA